MKTVLTAAGVVALAGSVASAAVLHNNGTLGGGNPAVGLSTGTVAVGAGPINYNSPVGTEWSEVQVGNTSAGFSANGTAPTNFRLADNFTITDAAGWNITNLHVYWYLTGGVTTAPALTNINLQIWSGTPGVGVPVFGDTTTNRLAGASATGLWRIFNHAATATAPATNRWIWDINVNVGVTLGPGTYYVDWQNSTGGGFYPSVTVPGSRGSGDALQFNVTYGPVLDTGNPATLPDVGQEMPFILEGTVVPAPATMALLGLGGLIVGRRRR
jgi:hypothetical protein